MNMSTMNMEVVFAIFTLLIIGLANGLDLTITPSETSDFADDDVNMMCKASGLKDAVSILSIEVVKNGTLPLVTLYPEDKTVVHSELLQNIKTNGIINKHSPTDSFLSITLVDPFHAQSGKYICKVVYKDNSTVLKTAQVSSQLDIVAIEMRNVLQKLNQLKQQGDEANAQTATMRVEINSMQKSLSTKDSEIMALRKAIAKLTAEKLNRYDLESEVKKILLVFYTAISNKNSRAIQQINRDLALLMCSDHEWQSFNNLCYKTFTAQKNWDDANNHCKSFGGSLAIIPDQATNDFFYTELKYGKRNAHYIGLHVVWKTYNGYARKWVNGKLITYSNFKRPKHHPSAQEKYCTVFFPQDAGWNDYPCGTKDEYICQADPVQLMKHYTHTV